MDGKGSAVTEIKSPKWEGTCRLCIYSAQEVYSFLDEVSRVLVGMGIVWSAIDKVNLTLEIRVDSKTVKTLLVREWFAGEPT